MHRSERIAGIARLEERKEREAAQALALARRRLDEVEARLAELRRYRDEYGERMRRDQGASVSIADLKRHQLFLRRLDEGVEHARVGVARAGDEWRRHQDAWRRQRTRVDALERVAGRHRADEARARDRRLERANDDRASFAASPRPEHR